MENLLSQLADTIAEQNTVSRKQLNLIKQLAELLVITTVTKEELKDA
jgi:hypothetical protein